MLELADAGDVAVLTLSHGKVNALDLELCDALSDALDGLAAGGGGAVVVTGAGPAFSAGVDLWRMIDEGPSYVDRFLPSLARLALTLLTFPKPLVAAVNGHAVAGGCVIACGADVRLMSPGRGRIGMSELYAGVSFPLAALECLRCAVGTRRATQLVLTGDALTAEQALATGLVHEVVTADLTAAAVARAQQLANDIPLDAFAATKAQLRRPYVNAVESFAATDDAACRQVWRRRVDDGGLRAFLERVTRRPDAS